ncbi:MAG TPA: 3-phosphoserine/phosphohydroxythreonine transaminase [Fibrobacteraceae bacterium]|nr:3-phosphoserine/phosphohydroxythreonine transaminase [Fibrobacteraceae bacterium]
MTKTVYNFSPGPSVLPEAALKAAAAAAIEFRGSGLSLLTMSHRSKPVVEMFAETEALLRELLSIPSNFKVMFLQGGASLQFCMVPMNLLPQDAIADYTDTGEWGAKATKEAKNFGKVNIAGSSKEATYTFIPKDLKQSADAVYLHVTSNNTIFGTQWKTFPTPVNPKAYLIADMSSDFLSRPIDWSKFGLVYAGAQKNAGPAGVCLVIVREDLLGKTGRVIPTMLDYTTHIKKDSMFNTPPVFSVYVMNETFKWLKAMGGVKAIQAINERKAAKLYAEIDRNPMFKGTAAVEDRSTMNVPFVFDPAKVPAEAKEAKEKEFLAFAKSRGLETLGGHRIVGGFRASIYNAMPEAGIDALISAMQDYAKQNGIA